MPLRRAKYYSCRKTVVRQGGEFLHRGTSSGNINSFHD